LPLLTERIRQRVDASRRSAFEARGSKLAQAQRASLEQAKSQATIAWDASPITTARLCAELWARIEGKDWSLVGNGIRVTWPQRLWNFDRPYRWNGFSGGYGLATTRRLRRARRWRTPVMAG